MLAEEKGCIIISTPNSTYVSGQMVSQAVPIRYYMVQDNLLTFTLNSSVEAATKVMASVRHRYFPVLDDDGHYMGVLSRRNLLNPHKKQLILVDHNEMSQAVDGVEKAEVLEIIDHHRIGSIETSGPVYFRNVPVGCTCTIVYQMYLENGVEVDRSTAGLMLSAILSDTLMFRSPTCTPTDERTARALAQLAGVNLEDYADAMFEAGGDITGKTAEEVFNGDYKIFNSGEIRFGVGQGSYLSEKNRHASEELVGPYLQTALEKQDLDYIFYMFTDVRSSCTELLMAGKGAETLIEKAFSVQVTDGMAVLPGVVSRKKQMIPALLSTIKQEEN
jgi:manganese-dependent inorganic pyrophosphatase